MALDLKSEKVDLWVCQDDILPAYRNLGYRPVSTVVESILNSDGLSMVCR